MFLPSTTCWSGSIADLSRPATMLFCLAELRSTCTIKVKVVIHLHLPVCHVTLMAFCWSSASSSANSSAWVIQSIYPAVYLLFICTYLGKPSKKKSLTFVKPPPDPPPVMRKNKKKYPQNCASENHFLIIFGIFFSTSSPYPP